MKVKDAQSAPTALRALGTATRRQTTLVVEVPDMSQEYKIFKHGFKWLTQGNAAMALWFVVPIAAFVVVQLGAACGLFPHAFALEVRRYVSFVGR
jgi:hypothetical protein